MKKQNKTWALLAPIVVLVLIGGVITAALALTNEATAPVIAEAQRQAAEKAMQTVLPQGADFALVESTEGLPEAVTEVQAAGNGAGYVITVSAKGYANMTVMVGVGSDGKVTGTQVLVQEETKGIGSKVVEDGSAFQQHLVGIDSVDGVEGIAGATMSSNGMKNAVQAALDAGTILSGGTVEAKVYEAPANLTDEVLAQYYPGASFTDVPGGKVSDAGTVVYAGEAGMTGPVPVAVLFGADGQILAVVADTSAETPEYGQPLGENGFTDAFAGVSGGGEVDGVSGATITSDAIKGGVDYAIANLETVKGAG